MSGPTIQDLGRLGRLQQPLTEEQGKTQQPNAGPSFGEALENALRTVDGQLGEADQTATDYVSGKGGDLHTVLLEMERADLQFRTMLQVRNKLIDAYKEVMRMPV